MHIKDYKKEKIEKILFQLNNTVKNLMMSGDLSEFERGLAWSAYENISCISRQFQLRMKNGDNR